MTILRCWAARNVLDLFVDGRLVHEQEHAVAEHLAACADCRAEAEALKPLPFKSAEAPPVPPGLAASILRRLAEEEALPAEPFWRLTPAQAAGLAAAALLALSHAAPGPKSVTLAPPPAEAAR